MDDEGFLRAIIDNPGDDEPRLVYASWLEEHGQPERAEFIRIQCEAEHLLNAGDSRWLKLRTRARKLLAKNASHWLGRLNGSVRGRVYRRGFLEEAQINARTLLGNADAFFRLGPIKMLKLEGAANYMADIAALPQLVNVRMLNLQENRLAGEHVRTLVRSPYVRGLEWLSFEMNNIGNEGAAAIAASSQLTSLAAIRLDHTGIGDEGLQALAESPYLGKLKIIFLCGVHVDRRRRGGRALVARFGTHVLA